MSGSLRENVGKKDAKALRRQDRVPCVMYGKTEQVLFSVPQVEFKPLVFSPDAAYIELTINGEKRMAMLKDIEYHPVTDNIMHADFYELSDDKPIIMSIPVYLTGTSVGVMKGGKAVLKIKRLKVKALPANMPEKIVLDITNLDLLQGIKVQEVETNILKIVLSFPMVEKSYLYRKNKNERKNTARAIYHFQLFLSMF